MGVVWRGMRGGEGGEKEVGKFRWEVGFWEEMINSEG
jgi:hypothetical protein